jgi:predicted RNA-binding protein with TRAM domain
MTFTDLDFKDLEKPVELDGIYDVKIEDIGRKGGGIARINGLVVFVPRTKIAESVKIRITAVRRNYAFGEVV